MARAALDLTTEVTVFCGIARGVITWMAWLRDFLVNNPVQLFFGEEVIMAMKNDGDPVLYHKLMDRGLPAGALLPEAVAALGISPAPFIKPGRGNASAGAAIDATS